MHLAAASARFRRSWWAPGLLLAFAIAALAAVPASGDEATSVRGFPSLRIVQVSSRGIWVAGTHATVRWEHCGLSTGLVRLESSRDGRTWDVVAQSPTVRGGVTFIVDDDPGRIVVRLRATSAIGSPVISRRRRARVVPRVEDVVPAGYFAVSRQSDGTTRVWGVAPAGTLSAGSVFVARPRDVLHLTDVVDIAAGATHVLAARFDGSAWLWGDFDGETGPSPVLAVPVRVAGVDDVVAVSTGFNTAFFRYSDGRVFAAGLNHRGSLGDGTDSPRDAPVEVSALRGAQDIAVGNWFGLATTNDGSVIAWGDNHTGVLGDGTLLDRYAPVRVEGIAGAVAVAAGFDHAMALTRDGRVYTWGRNHFLQLGRATPDYTTTPGQIPGLEQIVSIAITSTGGFALDGDGNLYGWGENSSGFVGDGTTEPRQAPTPVRVKSINRMYSGPGSVVHAFTPNHVRYAWGLGTYGLIGDGRRRAVRPRPLRVFAK